MIIVGAGNLGKLIIDQMIMDSHPELLNEIVFFDNISDKKKVFDKFSIYNNIELIPHKFNSHNYFVAIGNPRLRKRMDSFMIKKTDLKPTSIISEYARVSNFSRVQNHLYVGPLTGIYHSCTIGYCNIIHSYVKIDHGVSIGDYVNLSTGVTLLADCTIGDFTFVGANALVLPNVKVGQYCYISANAVIKTDMSDYETR